MDNVERWKTLSGKRVTNVLDDIVKATITGQRVIHVGCDSQQHGIETEFVVVIVMLNPGKGGRVYWKKERVPRIEQLRERLLKEVWMSIETAMKVNAVVSHDVELSVHVDANPDLKFKSSQYIKELVGMVAGCGLNVLTKPEAWAAMHVADHVVKHKNER